MATFLEKGFMREVCMSRQWIGPEDAKDQYPIWREWWEARCETFCKKREEEFA